MNSLSNKINKIDPNELSSSSAVLIRALKYSLFNSEYNPPVWCLVTAEVVSRCVTLCHAMLDNIPRAVTGHPPVY